MHMCMYTHILIIKAVKKTKKKCLRTNFSLNLAPSINAFCVVFIGPSVTSMKAIFAYNKSK